MDLQQRTRRFGMAVILCALCLRLWEAGVPRKLAQWLVQPNTAAFLIYLETGRDVRFSASEEVFSPFFRESPAPWVKTEEIPPLPSFSAEAAALVEVYNSSGKKYDLPSLLQQPLSWNLRQESPTVLILHTHTTESYTKNGEDYEESSAYRTLDESYNMLSIGARVAEILEENGIRTLQDETLHDYPSYNGSYVHARNSLTELLAENPSVKLVLDLHRDASGGSGGQLRTLAEVEGKSAAQMMLVMGTNYENWEENLALAAKLQVVLQRQAPGIMRPLNLRGQRFNQDLSGGALLVEMGAAGNTHAEALLAAEALAEAIISLAEGTE